MAGKQNRAKKESNRGRKTKYEAYVQPRLKEIIKWAESGATEAEMCDALGIAVSTFNEYKNKHSELSEALRTGRQKVILEIKAALFKKATGFYYEESIGEKKDGMPVSIKQFRKYSPPDPQAAAMLLRNYDKNWIDKDTITTDFKRQEIELKKAIAEANNFDLDLKGE